MSLSQTPFIMSPILSESTPSEYLASTGTTGKCNELPLFFVAINVPTIKMPVCFTKGSRKNKFAELALRFGSDLADPIEQNRRNSELFRGVCE